MVGGPSRKKLNWKEVQSLNSEFMWKVEEGEEYKIFQVSILDYWGLQKEKDLKQ